MRKIRQLRGKDCQVKAISELSACSLGAMMRAGQLRLYFVRFDEDAELIQEMPLSASR
jgi:hypothetical protein